MTTADAFAPVTGFVPALHAAKVKTALVIASASGFFQYRLCYRVGSTSRDEPGSWSTTFDQWRKA